MTLRWSSERNARGLMQVVLENDALRLSFLPRTGGRLSVDSATGARRRNPLAPSHAGSPCCYAPGRRAMTTRSAVAAGMSFSPVTALSR